MTNIGSFWAGICERVREQVEILNRNGQQLSLNPIGNGFQIARKSPYLTVERWRDGEFINGLSRSPNKQATPAVFPPVHMRDDGDGQVLLKQDNRSVTVGDVVSDAVRGFLDPRSDLCA
jgi:hypothetical protein